MPDPRQQDNSLGEGGLMFGKYITVCDGVWSAEVLKLVQRFYRFSGRKTFHFSNPLEMSR